MSTARPFAYNTGTQTSPTSWIANFYRDGTYQWLEVISKSTLRGSVWGGDLNG
jgi:hypothetical protein